MNTKNNARSQESRRALRSALLSLLDLYELTDISVAQLCREAGVNRSTFYAHYENIWNVLDDLESEMDTELLSQFHWVKDQQSAMMDQRSLLVVTQHIASYPAFFRARLNNAGMQQGRFKVGMDWMMEEIILPYAKSLNDTPLLPYYISFGKAGIFEVLRMWVDDNCKESPECIAQLLYDMSIKHFLEK